MDIKINPTTSLNGEILAPPSKSYSHRAFIAASFADGVSIVKNPLTVGDVGVTIDLLKELGVNIREEVKNSYIVEKTVRFLKPIHKTLDCKNSGTTIRIFSALSLLIEGGLTFSGTFLKKDRPLLPLLDSLKNLGADYKFSKNSVHIQRVQKFCNKVKIQGDVSSQFITALLFLSPFIRCNNNKFVEIEITTPLVSYPYVKITLDVLNSFGIKVYEKIDEKKIGTYKTETGQKYRPQVYTVPGDFSSAAFIIVATVLSPNDSEVVVNNLDFRNPQGDKKIIEILSKMGANITINKEKNQIVVKGGITMYPLKGIEIDCNETPDLFPILSVVGAFAEGKTTLFNAKILRIKESDRIAVMARELIKMGAKVEEEEDRLTVYKSELKASKIEHENDHRIAMACCIAALFAKSSSTIENVEVVSDSYPTFIEDLKKLGAKID
jgi:3-phosphoshikimate 1-carboxyvinyltransferase